MNDQSLEAIDNKASDYYSGVRSEMLRYFPVFVEVGYSSIELRPINKGKSIGSLFYQPLSLGLIGWDISYPQFAVSARKSG